MIFRRRNSRRPCSRGSARLGASLFAIGIVEAGIVASITISTSSAYAFAEVAQTPHSLNLPIKEGRAFYSMLFLWRPQLPRSC